MSKPRARAVLYARVSTHMQERDGVSLDAQIDMARRFCDMRGFDLVEQFVDTMTGTSDARPGLARLEEGVKAREFDAVLVYKVDRLSRDAAHYHRLLQEFERHEVGLASLTQDIDATTSMGRLILRILIALAEHESEQTGDRIRDSIRYRARQGRIIAGRHAPLGYRYIKARTDGEGLRHPGRLEVDDDEAAVVRAIFAAFLQRRSVLGALQVVLDAGLAARGGSQITRKLVRDVLAAPVYRGELVSCRNRTIKQGGKKVTVAVKPEAWIRHPGAVPAIVDAATWQAAADILALNAAQPPGAMRGRGRHAWSGLIRCACGQGLAHTSKAARPGHTARKSLYCCTARVREGKGACPLNIQVNEQFLDLFVAPAIVAALEDASHGRLRGQVKARPRPAGRDFAAEMAKLEARRRKVRRMFEMTDMPEDEYLDRMAEIARLIAEVQADQTTAPLAAAPAPPPRGVREMWNRLKGQPAERNRLLASLIEYMVTEDQRTIRVYFRATDHPAWPAALTIPIVRLSTKEGRAARGVAREGGRRKGPGADQATP